MVRTENQINTLALRQVYPFPPHAARNAAVRQKLVVPGCCRPRPTETAMATGSTSWAAMLIASARTEKYLRRKMVGSICWKEFDSSQRTSQGHQRRRRGRAQLPAMGFCLSLFLENRRDTEMRLPLHKIHGCRGIHQRRRSRMRFGGRLHPPRSDSASRPVDTCIELMVPANSALQQTCLLCAYRSLTCAQVEEEVEEESSTQARHWLRLGAY